MAGKPDLSVSPQQQPPGVQNVVVYVSNDNFAQAYAVNHQQNVAAAAFTSQGSATPISQQNGGTLAYAATEAATTATTGVSPMAPMAKNILSKAPESNQHNFYTTPNVPNVITQNGFAYHNHLNPVPVLNTVNANTFDTSSAVKNVISFSASPSSGGTSEIYSLTSDNNKQQNVQVFAQTEKPNNIQVQFAPVNSEKHNNTSSVHNIQNRSEISVQNSKDIVGPETTYITTENGNFVAVMGAEVTGNQNVVFPRCDSVRSETAESSCSSLSSGDSPVVESSGSVVLMQNGSATNNVTNSGEVLMYDNNSAVSVSVRPGQTLGNLVLTMVPPPSGAGTASVAAAGVPVVGAVQQQQQQQHTTQQQQQPTSVTVPLGWKRIITNGMVIYIRTRFRRLVDFCRIPHVSSVTIPEPGVYVLSFTTGLIFCYRAINR